MQWEHKQLFSFTAFSWMKKPHAIKLLCASDVTLHFCTLGRASNADIHRKWLLLYLVKRGAFPHSVPMRDGQRQLVSESLVPAGWGLVAAHCKKRVFFHVFNSLILNNLNLTPAIMKRLMISKDESCLEFPDIPWTRYFGALFIVSNCFFQGCREERAAGDLICCKKGPYSYSVRRFNIIFCHHVGGTRAANFWRENGANYW